MTTPSHPSDCRSVVVVGHVCIDENTGAGAGDDSPRLLRRTAGSPAFFINRQLQLSRGIAVAVIAPYGGDFLEVETSIPLLNPARPGGTLLYRNHISGDIRRQECFHAGNAEPVPIAPVYRDSLAAADIVMVGPLLPNFTRQYLESVFAPARPDALKLLLVQGYLRTVGDDGSVAQREFAEYAEVIPRFDVIVFSDEDLRDALAVAERWSREFPQTKVVVTQNRNGATCFEAGASIQVPATPLERQGIGSVIGAGDVFSAALAVSYRESGDIRDAIGRAHAVTAAFIDGEQLATQAA